MEDKGKIKLDGAVKVFRRDLFDDFVEEKQIVKFHEEQKEDDKFLNQP